MTDPLATAKSLFDQEKYDEALKVFEVGVPPSEQAYALWARALHRKHDLPAAAAKALEGLQFFPTSPDVQYALAAALFDQKNLDQATIVLNTIEAVDAKYGRAHWLKAEILRSRAQYGASLDKYAAVLQHDPEFINRESARMRASFYNGWGNALYALRRYAEAREKYEKACAVQGGSVVHWNNLGTVDVALERWFDSVEHYRKAESLDPSYALTVKGLATALSRAGLSDLAEAQFQKAIQTPPLDLWAPAMYASALWRCGRYRDAKRQAYEVRDRYVQQRTTLVAEGNNEDFTDAAQIFATMLDDHELANDALHRGRSPRASALAVADLYLTSAGILLERCEREVHAPRGLRERAYAACRAAILEMRRHMSTAPQDAPPRDAEQRAMGRAFLLIGDVKEAKTYLTRMPMHEQSIETLLDRALLALEMKEYPSAVAAAEAALSRDSEDIATRVLLAEALLLGGELDRCETEVRHVLQRAPGTVEAYQILAKVMLEQADQGDGDLYGQAIVELDRAWTLAGSAGASKPASPTMAASVHYLRGFAYTRMYDAQQLKDESLIIAARDAFRRCLAIDRTNHRAAIALRKVEDRLAPRSEGWISDRVAGAICGLIALFILATASIALGGGHLSAGYAVIFVFGGLLFLIASFYLPHLLKLKVGTVELEKAAVNSSVSKVPLQIRKAPLQ